MKIQKALMRLVYYYPFYVVVLGVIFVIIVLLCSGAKAQSFKNGSFENSNANGCLLGTSYQMFNSSVQNTNEFITNGSGLSLMNPNYCGQYLPTVPDGNFAVGISTRMLGDKQGMAMDINQSLVVGQHYCFTFNYQSDSAYTQPQGYTSLLIGLSNDSTQFGTEIKRLSKIARSWATDTVDFIAPANYSFVTLLTDSTLVGTYFIDNFKFVQENTGIETISNEFAVYPNPANNEIHFSKQVQSVSLISLDGGVVQKDNLVNQIRLAKLQSGIYLLLINNQFTYKINIQQ